MTFEKGEKFARDRGMRFFETRCGPPHNSWLGALTHHPNFRINSMMNDFCVHVDELCTIALVAHLQCESELQRGRSLHRLGDVDQRIVSSPLFACFPHRFIVPSSTNACTHVLCGSPHLAARQLISSPLTHISFIEAGEQCRHQVPPISGHILTHADNLPPRAAANFLHDAGGRGWQVDFGVDGSRKRMEHIVRLGHGGSAEMVPGACLDWVRVVHATLQQHRPFDGDRFHPCASLADVRASTRKRTSWGSRQLFWATRSTDFCTAFCTEC